MLRVLPAIQKNITRWCFSSSIPALPTSYPTPRTQNEDALLSLYKFDWGIDSKGDGVKQLAKRFKFGGFKTAMKFVNGVADIAHSEKHHPSMLINFSVVDIYCHTHSAIRAARSPNEDTQTRLVPGITDRDIRFALLIEELCTREFASTKKEQERIFPQLNFAEL